MGPSYLLLLGLSVLAQCHQDSGEPHVSMKENWEVENVIFSFLRIARELPLSDISFLSLSLSLVGSTNLIFYRIERPLANVNGKLFSDKKTS